MASTLGPNWELLRGDFQLLRLGHDALRHGLQIPDQSGPGHYLQQVVSGVHFPPEESLAGRAHESMVIIVPSLAHRDERQPEIVAAVVFSREATVAPDMGERIDEECSVQQEHAAYEEAPKEYLPTGSAEAREHPIQKCAEGEEQYAKNRGHYEVKPIEEDELRELSEITYRFVVGREVFAAGHPADM